MLDSEVRRDLTLRVRLGMVARIILNPPVYGVLRYPEDVDDGQRPVGFSVKTRLLPERLN